MDINTILIIITIVGVWALLYTAPGILIKLVLYFTIICIVFSMLTGCVSENWSFKPNAKIKTDEISRDKPTKGIEVEEVQGQIEYKF